MSIDKSEGRDNDMSTYSARMAYRGSAKQLAEPRRTVWERLHAMALAWRTRRLLARMDDRMLADIGIGRGDAMMEAARPLWDIDTLR